MESLGLPQNWIMTPILALIGFAIAFCILGGVILNFKQTEVKTSRVRKTEIEYPISRPPLSAKRRPIRPITIRLDQCALDIEKTNILGEKVRKSIFKPITTSFEPGVLNVIMGPSGSGKTSLLNFMARRLHSTFSAKYCSSGRLLFNGCLVTESVLRSICSYVPQEDDGLLPSLTVRETLHFAARLRLPSKMAVKDKIRQAEAILLKLGLKDCADTLIGSELVKGISGGERRRVSIAIQILTKPRILLLDEPTSGLDAFTALTIIDVLKDLAKEGRTIILTIHQPRSDLFKQFGNVLLMARGGDVVYSGDASRMLSHFESLGFSCDQNKNPADFALDLVTVDLQHITMETSTTERINRLIAIWKAIQAEIRDSSGIDASELQPYTLYSSAAFGLIPIKGKFKVRSRLSAIAAFPILIHRGLINLARQPNLATGRITQLLGLGIVLTAFFAPLGNDYFSVQTRIGYVTQISIIFFVGMLNAIAIYPAERAIFYREDSEATYALEAFVLYYLALEVPLELVGSILFTCLAVFAAGLPKTVSTFFFMVYNVFCVVSCGESLGIVFLTLFSHTGLAVSIMSVLMGISMLLGGAISLNIPGFLQSVNHLNPVKWQTGGLAALALRGVTFTCTEEQQLGDGTCPIQNGDQVLQLYNLDIDVVRYTLALGLVALGYRLFAYVVLKARRIVL